MSTFKERLNYKAENALLHTAWVKLLTDQGYTHTLTLQWNRSISYEQAFRDCKTLHAKVDRGCFGARFNRSADRTEAIFFVEGEERVNLHVHSQWQIKPEHRERFEAMFSNGSSGPGAWKDIAPSGSQKLIVNNDAFASGAYITKENHLCSDARKVFFSRDFLPASMTETKAP